ncbi:MAG: right-handed parallel beta-helix repeat-containing protein [Opitutales bacterium]
MEKILMKSTRRKWRWNRWLLGASVFLFISSNAMAATYYVATNGDNSNSGTINSPWATPHYGVNQLSAGDTLYIRGGTYNMPSTLEIPVSGTAGAWVTVAGYQNEMPVLDFSVLTGGDGIVIRQQDYVRLEGVRVEQVGESGLSGNLMRGIYINRSNNIDILYNEIYLIKNAGLRVYAGPGNPLNENIRFIGNYIEEACTETYRKPGETGVILGEHLNMLRTRNGEIAYNEITGGTKESIDVYVGNNGVVVHNNYVHDVKFRPYYVDNYTTQQFNIELHSNIGCRVLNGNSEGLAVNTEDGILVSGVNVHHNLFFDVENFGFKVQAQNKGGAGESVRDVQVWNNTFYNCSFKSKNATIGIGSFGLEATENFFNIDIRNNIIGKPGGTCIQNLQNVDLAAKNITIAYNLFDGPSQVLGTNFIMADPQFVDPANADFSLQASSPAIDAGDPDPFYNDPDGTRNDIGAFYFDQSGGIADDFESGDLSGGTGWADASWADVGNKPATVQSAVVPAAGSGNSVELIHKGAIERGFAPLSAGTDLTFAYRIDSFESPDLALVDAFDGSTWSTVWSRQGQNGDGTATVSLAAGTSAIRFRLDCNWETDYWYIDDIAINAASGGSGGSGGGSGSGEEWLEDFNLADGTNNDTGATAWSVDTSGITGNLPTFSVQNGAFEARDTGGEAIWFSEIIDVNGSADIAVDIQSGGTDAMEAADTLTVAYIADGGAETLIASRSGNFNGDAPETVSVTGVSALTIQVVIRAKVSYEQELFAWDNVTINGLDTWDGYIEAENYDNVTNFTPFEVQADSGASGGQYIVWPNDGTNRINGTADDSDTGQAYYNVSVVDAGDVTVWARVNFASGADDSFHYKLDGHSGWQTQNGWSTGGQWQWKEIATFTNVTSGDYTFRLLRREDGSQIDRLYFAADGSTPQ